MQGYVRRISPSQRTKKCASLLHCCTAVNCELEMPATKKKKPSSKSTAARSPKIRVRMYRQGLGDCFLLTFFTGREPVHMLIDCGTLGSTTTGVKMQEVVKSISE